MNDSLFIFRAPENDPDQDKAGRVIGSVGKAIPGSRPGGFVIGSFTNNPADTVSIPYHIPMTTASLNDCLEQLDNDRTSYSFPEISTSREEHRKAVEYLVSNLADNEKCISAKAIVRSGRIDYERSFANLCEHYPNAFVFCFHTPQTGTWIGATPERLLSVQNGVLRTMALAGTRPAGIRDLWDNKNIEEHRIVADFIEECLAKHCDGSEIERSGTEVAWAGCVEHLRTDFKVDFTESDKKPPIVSLLSELSPTPALCGYPRDKAMTLIEQTESFRRGYYGGWLGYLEQNECDLFVNLRSVWTQRGRWGMFAGGGILNDSDPDTEWWETEAKAESILSCIE